MLYAAISIDLKRFTYGRCTFSERRMLYVCALFKSKHANGEFKNSHEDNWKHANSNVQVRHVYYIRYLIACEIF